MNRTQFGIKFLTGRTSEQVEDWLVRHCGDGWDIRLGGIAEDDLGNIRKQLLVVFEREYDRELFRHHFLNH